MNIKHVILVVATFCVVPRIDFAQPESKQYFPGEVIFKVRNAGIDVTGTIDITELHIMFDEKNPGKSQVLATADPNKINTGITIRDNHLRRADYFDVLHYPTIKLQSTDFKKVGKYFEGRFDLTIKNVTKSVVIPFTRKQKNDSVIFNGSFVIKRSDFHLGEDSAILGELVTVYFSVVEKRSGVRLP